MENNSSNTDANHGKVLKQKERHIVSWSQELGNYCIKIQGQNYKTVSKKAFELTLYEPTAPLCRWFTYLNSDFKRGWSPEETCSYAQKIFGNRWTEIAKVVSGRTDNAVKNRFTTLCKKRAKREALAKENSATSYINLNNKRVISRNGLNADGGSESAGPLKKMRTNVSSTAENFKQGEKLACEYGVSDHLLRPPFAVLAQRVHSCEVNFHTQLHANNMKEASSDGWSMMYMSHPQPALNTVPDQLYSNAAGDKTEECEAEVSVMHQETGHELLSDHFDQNCAAEENGICHTASTNEVENMLTCNDVKADNEAVCLYSNNEFSSPLHVTPLFRALAATIPSPKFSESVRILIFKSKDTEHQCYMYFMLFGKALLNENTRNGVNFPKPNHQSLSTSTLQAVSSPLSMTILTHQPYT
ncbi:UNVERIFIED_CONTAM: Transcription factor [Sesamum latifolium]|uniref:Transcription factor n=1 Tax=Sesamum latifolium TaxID=2727402 RepID=A0AAW2X0G7_9LAMI